jgi:beta-galactosidase
MLYRKLSLLLAVFSLTEFAIAQPATISREHIRMDNDWCFALGHPYNTSKDFDNGTSSFSYLAKTGYGDGPASTQFDDRAWRKVNLPHDWAVELPFDSRGSGSHGYKAIGRNFPDASVGWYRKNFTIPQTDLGKHISIAFDGVGRNSIVWVNGHYLGTEPSGYQSFEYDIAEYLNYGGENVIAVRADVTMEEGWFYEGAGIYRHVWLNKTDQLHIAVNGTFVTSKVHGRQAIITASATILNSDLKPRTFSVRQEIIDAAGKTIATVSKTNIILRSFATQDVQSELTVANARLWSLEDPYLHHLITTIEENGKTTDSYHTTFGVRTIRFDANQGFFLNGKHVEIKGTNNHQDHAGVGCWTPATASGCW